MISRLTVTAAWMIETTKVDANIKIDIGTLNSVLPFVKKYMCIPNVNIPTAAITSEKIKPAKVFCAISAKPYKKGGITIKLNIKNPVMPPASLKSFHSFQYAASISWLINRLPLIKYVQNKMVCMVIANSLF